jgi:Xaa-Pro aminopeptidase
MFQSFEVTSTPQFGKERTTALRAALATLGVDGFLVPRADEFQGEYVPRSSERLSWLTGFTGSAGGSARDPSAKRSSSSTAVM